MPKVKITIDGKEIIADEGSNLLEVARHNGIEIPSLCHDPRLEPFGACRQCLIEVEGARGPVQACGAKVQQGMTVRTNSENIESLRRLGLELLLSDHCGDCVAPCQLACPAGIDIQGFVAHLANDRPLEAAKLVREKLPLPGSVGRVCPRFCEKECRRNLIDKPVSICALKRFVGDIEMQHGKPYTPPIKANSGKKVAIIGGGPAGLAAAYFMAIEGHQVSIFEAAPELGGMMRYGIPEYRLPKLDLDKEIKVITDLCQGVYFNKALGRDFNIQQLKNSGFDAIFVGIGSWANQSLRLPGEDMEGVSSGIHFLREIASKREIKIGQKVVVIGGGNTAMDAARTLVRLGVPDVTVVYRRSREEMPANPHEIDQAEEEGVKFELLTAPVAFLGEDGKVKSIRCVKMELGAPDGSGRRRPVPVKGSEFEIAVDMVITATGQKLQKASLHGSPELVLNPWGDLQVDSETLQSSVDWIFSGGDCVTGPATVVEAMAAGRKAADSINKYLKGEEVKFNEKPFNCSRGTLDEIDPTEFVDYEKIPRISMPTLLPEIRKNNFREFELGFTPVMAKRETDRCLSCGCQDVFTCRLREYATQLKVRPDKLGFGKQTHPVFEDHPHIIRDPNKCILCGNCVRICQEVQMVDALGFVNRGSDTVVLSSLRVPLAETMCNSCGQCIDICPTGALTRKSWLSKPGPWETDKIPSICPHCNIGCKLELNIAGDRIVGVTSPVSSDSPNEGNICIKGTFGYSFVHSSDRLLKPLINRDGDLEETSWAEAFATAGELLRRVRDTYGLDKIAVTVSPRMTNEENYLAYKLGRMALGTNKIYSNIFAESPLCKSAKKGQSTFDNLLSSDLILVVDSDISAHYPVVAHKIKKAVARGSKLLVISPHVTNLNHLAKATLKINAKKNKKLFEAFISYILQYNLVDKKVKIENISLVDSLKNSITEDFFDIAQHFWVKPAKIINLIHLFLRAKKPAIVVDGNGISPEEMMLLKQFSQITGNLSENGQGMITLYPHGNIQGQLDLGIEVANKRTILDEMKLGLIKAILILDDGSSNFDKQLIQPGVKTVLVTPMKPKGVYPDVVLPGATFAETNGSFTNCEGRIQSLTAGFAPIAGKGNWQVLVDLASALGYHVDYAKENDVFNDLLIDLLK